MAIFKDLGILPIPSTVFSLNIKLAHKTLNLESPKALQNILGFQWRHNLFPCMYLLFRPYTRTTFFGYRSIRNKTVIYWNALQMQNKNAVLITGHFSGSSKSDQKVSFDIMNSLHNNSNEQKKNK